jgi:chromosome segregation ATPase
MACIMNNEVTSVNEEIKTLRQIIEGLKRNNAHLNYDIEKTRQWAIKADKELDFLKRDNGKLTDEITILKYDVTVLKELNVKLEKESAIYREQNARLHEILNGM